MASGSGRVRVTRLAGFAVLAAGLVVSPWVLANAWVNLALPGLVNRHPERLELRYDYAWMVVPGHVHVHGLVLSGTGLTDAWRLSADDVSGTVALGALRERRFVATDLVGSGVAFAYSRRPTPEVGPRPRLGVPWSLDLTGVTLADVRSVTFGDYGLSGGNASVANGRMQLAGSVLTLGGTLKMNDLEATRGADALAVGITGELAVAVDGLDRKADLGRGFFDRLTATAKFDADVNNLDFLSFYLAKAPWLSIRGAGHVRADLANQGGRMLRSSVLVVDAPGTVVGFLGWEVAGDCRLQLDVGADRELPGSRLQFDFTRYSVQARGSTDAIVEGDGFRVLATTPDVSFREPFTALDVLLAIPPASIPSFSRWDGLLPADLGMALSGGVGEVHGAIHANTADNTAWGDVVVRGTQAHLQLGAVAVTSDLAVDVRLREGHLDTGVYDLSGTRMALSDLTIRSPNQPDETTTGWTASMTVVAGEVRVGQPIYFEADLVTQCRDSTPFLTMFAEKRALPGFARNFLTIRGISGSAHVALGVDRVDLRTVSFRGDRYEILLHLLRMHDLNYGAIFARLGPLSVAVGVSGHAKHIQLTGAREWYERGPEPGDFASEETQARKRDRAARQQERRTAREDR